MAEGGRYLLVRESKVSAGRRWNLPAGKPVVGETLIEAAVREAKEETGLQVAVEHLVGIYQCPRASEGFGVVNFVFASRIVGGSISLSRQHPEVAYFTKSEIGGLADQRLLRGAHILRAIEAHDHGQRLPLSVLEVVPPSPMP